MTDIFKIEGKVWAFDRGWGKVVSTSDTTKYPIKVKFENGDIETYTQEGKYHREYNNRVLFFAEILIPEEAIAIPIACNIEPGTLVWVWDTNKSKKAPAIFQSFNSNNKYPFKVDPDDEDGNSYHEWTNCEIHPLAMAAKDLADIKAKLA